MKLIPALCLLLLWFAGGRVQAQNFEASLAPGGPEDPENSHYYYPYYPYYYYYYYNCGDGYTGNYEDCDGDDLNGRTCEDFGGNFGTLQCDPDFCFFDTSLCSTCGDAFVEGEEECDNSNLNGASCANGGILRCDENCRFDTSGCSGGSNEDEDEDDSSDISIEAGASFKADFCFSGLTSVDVLGRGTILMQDLQVNDVVYTGSTHGYQPVYSFGHLDPTAVVDYIQIYHSKNTKAIELSAAHLIYLLLADQSTVPVRADSVRQGDTLLFNNSQMEEQVKVTKIDTIARQGAYLPLTPSGNIVVNGIAASAYVSIEQDAPRLMNVFSGVKISQHSLLHFWLAPYRMMCMGVSINLCMNDYNNDGIIHWLTFGQTLAKIWEHQYYVVQVLGVLIVMMFLCGFLLAEMVLGPCFGWVGIGLAFYIALFRGKHFIGAKKAKMD